MMKKMTRKPIEDVILDALKQIMNLWKKSKSTDDPGTLTPDKEQTSRLILVLKFSRSPWWSLLLKLLESHDPKALKDLIKYLKENLSDETLKSVAKTLSDNASKPIAIHALKEIMNTVDAHFRNIISKTIAPHVQEQLEHQWKSPTPFPKKPIPI